MAETEYEDVAAVVQHKMASSPATKEAMPVEAMKAVKWIDELDGFLSGTTDPNLRAAALAQRDILDALVRSTIQLSQAKYFAQTQALKHHALSNSGDAQEWLDMIAIIVGKRP